MDIFAHDTLDYQSTELATLSAFASLTGTADQLQFHLGAAMDTGLTEAETKDLIAVLESWVDNKEADDSYKIWGRVSSGRAQ